jgi:RNA polymerase sigma factor (sigma-70 family)
LNLPPPDQAPSADQTRWFAEEVRPHESSLRAYLNGSFPAVRDIDDVVQESYLRVWKARALHPIDSAKAFLFTVARRLALDVVRRERRTPFDLGGDFAGERVYEDRPAAAETLARKEKVQLLIEAIDSLPPRCREIVILRKINLIPQREVAARLRISEKGVENLLSRGLARCREYLARRGIRSFFGDES